jgi:hypothetical protein
VTRRISPVRGTLAGVAGTAVMTSTLWLERRARRDDEEFTSFVDYDASPHVVIAASKVIRHRPSTDAGEKALFLLVHWGYGSVVAVLYDVIRARVRDQRVATLLFLPACQAMAFVLFPVLGETPPPWRWRPNLLISSIGQHTIYAVTVAMARSRLD